MTAWVVEHLGPDVPMHFTAFHPDFKMLDRPRTPAATLTRARAIALGNGVRFAYTGNVSRSGGGQHLLPGLRAAGHRAGLVRTGRVGASPAAGACTRCGAAAPRPVRRAARDVGPPPSAGAAGRSPAARAVTATCLSGRLW